MFINACEYSFRGKKVTFNAAIEDTKLVLSISNVGDVIAKEHKKLLLSWIKRQKHVNPLRGLGLGLKVWSMPLLNRLMGRLIMTPVKL